MTVRFKNELVRNITIKLGYANAKVRGRSFSAVVPHAPLQGAGHRSRHAGAFLTTCVDLQMRKRGLSSTGELSLASLRQGGQPAVRATGLWTPNEAHPSRLVRRLPGARHFDGYHAERRSGHGRRASSRRGERNVSTASDIGALGGRGDHEARAPHHPAK